jgi:hypothetical protein
MKNAFEHIGAVSSLRQTGLSHTPECGGPVCTLTPPDPQLKGAWYPGKSEKQSADAIRRYKPDKSGISTLAPIK